MFCSYQKNQILKIDEKIERNVETWLFLPYFGFWSSDRKAPERRKEED